MHYTYLDFVLSSTLKNNSLDICSKFVCDSRKLDIREIISIDAP